jgi:hypothetical protein
MQTAFRDFDGFEMHDVHVHAGKGDYHLVFDAFTVLVDAKMYSRCISASERDKIKQDLLRNDQIRFAWLVSLDTNVHKYDRAPFMFEWISDTQCICYVNALRKHEAPIETLRTVWFVCAYIHENLMMRIQDVSETELAVENTALRKKIDVIREKIQQYQRFSRDRDHSMRELRETMDKQDALIMETVTEHTNGVVSMFTDTILSWWNRVTVQCDESSLKSVSIWARFRRDEREISDKMNIQVFKNILVSILCDKNVRRSTGKDGIEVMQRRFVT